MSLALYIDDDSGAKALGDQAQRNAIRLLRSDEAGLRGASDERHLQFAADHQLAIVTANARDFIPLHWQWSAMSAITRG